MLHPRDKYDKGDTPQIFVRVVACYCTLLALCIHIEIDPRRIFVFITLQWESTREIISSTDTQQRVSRETVDPTWNAAGP